MGLLIYFSKDLSDLLPDIYNCHLVWHMQSRLCKLSIEHRDNYTGMIVLKHEQINFKLFHGIQIWNIDIHISRQNFSGVPQ